MRLRFRREFVIGVSVFCGLGAMCLRSKVVASPTTSPSAIHAARLKYTPPPGWIRHYLGDDRYKIDGNIWRVVSTQMDTYYHRPNCPNVLRQSADTVIGFPSGEDAIEAGYKPDPVCHPEEPVVEYGGSGGSGGMDMSSLGRAGGGADGLPGQAITLADGASTIKLPPGWQRLQSKGVDIQPRGESHVTHYTIDVFKPATGRGMVAIYTGIDPSQDMGNYFSISHIRGEMKKTQSKLNSLNNRIDNTGAVSGGLNNLGSMLQNFSNNTAISGATVGGLRGVRITMKANAFMPAMTSFSTGRGQKAYSILDLSGGAPGVNNILKSFHAR